MASNESVNQSKDLNQGAVQGNGHYIDIGDTRLFVEERGRGYPLLLLHGAPGAIDHRFFGNYLDPLCDQYRLILVDARNHGRSEPAPQRTWNFEQFVHDVSALARAMKLGRYAVLGHSYGAFVALQHAVSFPGDAAQVIISNGVPSTRFLWQHVERSLREFVPESLRDQIEPQEMLRLCSTNRCHSILPIPAIPVSLISRKSQRRLRLGRTCSVTLPPRVMARLIAKPD